MNINAKLGTRLFLHIIFTVLFACIYYFFIGREQFHGEDGNGKNIPFTFMEALYFSLVTQTTVGYGFVSPKTPLAKAIVSLQLLILIFIITAEFD
jgi:hypothetical protein